MTYDICQFVHTSIIKRSPCFLAKKKARGSPAGWKIQSELTRGVAFFESGRVDKNFLPTRRVTRVGATRVGALV